MKSQNSSFKLGDRVCQFQITTRLGRKVSGNIYGEVISQPYEEDGGYVFVDVRWDNGEETSEDVEFLDIEL